jgi:DNA-directed RNA polymerase specialized sigma24 family protein
MRGKLKELAKDLPKLTDKQMEVLTCVHPYIGGMTYREAAQLLCVSVSAIQDRLNGIYRRIPWLKEDMARKRKEETRHKESLRRPNRIGDERFLGTDGKYDTFHGERILRKF